jgi:hypothetical protein
MTWEGLRRCRRTGIVCALSALGPHGPNPRIDAPPSPPGYCAGRLRLLNANTQSQGSAPIHEKRGEELIITEYPKNPPSRESLATAGADASRRRARIAGRSWRPERGSLKQNWRLGRSPEHGRTLPGTGHGFDRGFERTEALNGSRGTDPRALVDRTRRRRATQGGLPSISMAIWPEFLAWYPLLAENRSSNNGCGGPQLA